MEKINETMNTYAFLPQLPPKDYFDVVILANGDYPSDPLVKEILETAPYVICCDGAFRHYMAEGHTPKAIIGDGDSTTKEEKELTKGLFHSIAEQDDNDLTKAVHFAQSQGKQHLLLLGATGKREDHTLGNITLLNYYFHHGIDATMLTDHGMFHMYNGNHQFVSFPHQQISIFNFNCTTLKSTGLQYPLYPLKEWWEGTLNEAEGEKFSIQADGDYLLFFVKGHKNLYN